MRTIHKIRRLQRTSLALAGAIALAATIAQAQSTAASSKLLLTGGVTSIEGSAGGGLTPWAVIGGYGTQDQIGANAFFTNVRAKDYELRTGGALIGIDDRAEISVARQKFDTRNVGAALGLGKGFTFTQVIVGAKVRLAGDAVLEQDSWLPQIAVGVQQKKNDRGALLRSLGVRSDKGTDVYVSATKLMLAESVLLNGTVRWTKANQTGILGFGTAARNKYDTMFEGSAAWLLRRDLALGVEFRQKPDHLTFKEDNWFDIFLAWAPTKNVSLTLAYADLGNIVIKDNQRATYLSIQLGF